MTPQAADLALFDGVLAHEDRRPAAFLAVAPDAATTLSSAAHAEMLLASLALSERVRGEDADADAEPSSALQRVEAKVDLLLGLIGAMLRERGDIPPPARLRWSARGARIDLEGDALAILPGARGVLRVQPADWLPDCIELPARVVASEHDVAWLAFDPLPASLAEALERHLFLLHRRQVAEARRQR